MINPSLSQLSPNIFGNQQYGVYNSPVNQMLTGQYPGLWPDLTTPDQSGDAGTDQSATSPAMPTMGSLPASVMAAKLRNQTMMQIAQMRAMGRLYHQPRPLNTAPVANWGEGIGQAFGNLANIVLDRQQEGREEHYLQNLQNQQQSAADQEAKATQDAANQEAVQQAATNQRIQNALVGQGMNPEVAYSVVNGDPKHLTLAKPYIELGSVGPTEQAKMVGQKVGGAQGQVAAGDYLTQALPPRLGISFADLNKGQVNPSVQATANLYGVGQLPDVNTYITDQAKAQEAVDNAKLAHVSAGFAQPNAETKLQGEKLQNFHTALMSQYQGIVNANEPQKIQAELRKQGLSSDEIQQRVDNATFNHNLLQNAIKNGDVYDPSKLALIQAQLKDHGFTGDLIDIYSKLQNPAKGAPLNPAKFAPKPIVSTPAAQTVSPASGPVQINEQRPPVINLPAPGQKPAAKANIIKLTPQQPSYGSMIHW